MTQEKLLDDGRRVGHEDGERSWNRKGKKGLLSKEDQESHEHVRVNGHGAHSVEQNNGADTDLVR
jgi:hypothetical protein